MTEYLEFIYFPTAFGDQYGYPFIIYAKDCVDSSLRELSTDSLLRELSTDSLLRELSTDNYVQGSKTIEELEKGRFSVYALKRCRPYTEELWKQCQQHITWRETLEAEYRDFLKEKARAK